MNLFQEINRRNVIRVGVAYAVSAWVVLQVADLVLDNIEAPAWMMDVVLLLTVLGFGVALVIAWAYEVTPEGLKRQSEVDQTQSITQQTARKLDIITLVALLLVTGLVLSQKFWGPSTVVGPSVSEQPERLPGPDTEDPPMKSMEAEPAGNRSVAVLPFADMSDGGDNQYFSDGVSEEILNVLAQLPSLEVTSRSSSFAFREARLPLTQVADELGVSNIVEGSVRRWNDRIRISVQLIDARRDVLLWSETYEREFVDMFRIQEDIALAIAETLSIELDLSEAEEFERKHRQTPVDPEAYEEYLRGIYLMAIRSRETLEEASAAFERALAIEPAYAEAMAQLAITYGLLSERNYGNLNDADSIALGKQWSARAQDLAPHLAESHAAVGHATWRAGEILDAEQQFQRALDINPNYAMVIHWLSMLKRRNLGKHEEAFALTRRARRLDPIAVPIINIYIQMLIGRGKFQEAQGEIMRLESLSPTAHHRMRAQLVSLNGQWAEGTFAYLDALKIDGNQRSAQRSLVRQLFRMDLDQETDVFGPSISTIYLYRVDRGQEAVDSTEAAYLAAADSVYAQQAFARALALNGELERARPLLDNLFEKSSGHIALVSPHFFSLRDALILFHARAAAGDENGAEEVLEAMDAEIARIRSAGITVTREARSIDYSEGIRHYLGGEPEVGLPLIERAIRDGYTLDVHIPYLQSLMNDPRAQPIRLLFEEIQARERGKLLKRVCNDNPYRDIWQPAEATCAEIR